MNIQFTQEGLERIAPHLLSQLRRLSPVDLETIRDACIGRIRTRNRSMLTNLESCGKEMVGTLWEAEGGRKLVETSVDKIIAERRGPVDATLCRHINKLA